MQFYFLGYNYATCLSIEILFKIRHRSNLLFKARLISYHAISWILASSFTVLLWLFHGYGISGLNTCTVTNDSFIHILEYAPFGLNLPIMWFSVIYSLIHLEKRYTSITMNFIMIILSVSITWFFPTFFKLIVLLSKKTGNWTYIAFIIGTLSGSFVGISRLMNRKVIKEIKARFYEYGHEMKSFDLKIGKVEINEQLLNILDSSSSILSSSDLDFFTNFFDNLSKNVKNI